MWDLKTRRVISELHKFEDNDDGFLRVCADDSVIAVNSRLGRLFFYDVAGNPTNEVKTNMSGGFAGCRLLGTDLWFADAFNGGLWVFDMRSGSHFLVATCKGHGMVMDISVHDGVVGVAFEDSFIVAYDPRNPMEPLWRNDLKLGEAAISLALVGREKAVIGSAQRQLLLIGPESREIFYELPDGHPGVSDIAVRIDGKIWATGGWDMRVRMFDAKKRKALAVLKHHSGSVHTVGFSADGLLASAGQDRGIALWSLYRK
jgi:WD40 repeat protein